MLTAPLALCAVLACAPQATSDDGSIGPAVEELDRFIEAAREAHELPGLAVAVLRGGRLVWARGYGQADIEEARPMRPQTIMNIASISKTVTATAVMQLWEQGEFELDDDVDEYLPFSVRNPAFPDEPLTIRQLLTHRSSIMDGSAYDESYTLGDPTVELGAWLRACLTPEGELYDAEQNFHAWRPGTENPPARPRSYSNVGFGLLGYLVECIAEQPFSAYCHEHIFEPLGMSDTGWYLAEVDSARHAVPYSYLEEDLSEDAELESMLPRYAAKEQPRKAGAQFPHGLYSFPNYPDGLLRTSVAQMSKHVLAIMNGGALSGPDGERRILAADTVAYMLSQEHFGRALCWDRVERADGELLWGHDGSDPGVTTRMAFQPRDGLGVIVFVNGAHDGGVFEHLFANPPPSLPD